MHKLLSVTLFFLLGFSLTLPAYAATNAKVSAVIPVKFKSQGMHAPVPYSQQLMNRGWTRVPTLNLPFTFSGGGQFGPKFNPTQVSKKSIAKSIGKLSQNASRMHPALKAAAILYGAYELNCMTQNYPSLCMPDPEAEFGDADFAAGGLPPETQFSWECSGANSQGIIAEFSGTSPAECLGAYADYYNATAPKDVNNGSGGKYSLQLSVLSCTAAGACSMRETRTTVHPTYGTTVGYTNFQKGSNKTPEQKICPPETTPAYPDAWKYVIGPVAAPGTVAEYCWKPVDDAWVPITPEWVEERMDENPVPIRDIGLDDFVDWETGAPIPDLFDDPKVDDVSDDFRDAAEGAARDVLQSDNPNAPYYVPPSLRDEFIEELGKWYEGQPFRDVFTGKDVNPTQPTPDPVKTDWKDFPGITQKQYEASNNAWATAAKNSAPDVQKKLDDATKKFDDLKEKIEDVPSALPYEMDFAALFQLPTSGACVGFSVPTTVGGRAKTIIVNQHCPPYEAWGRPVIDWFLGILTILQIFHIFRRTLEVA